MLNIDINDTLQISNPKINTNFQGLDSNKQSKITSYGILKGTGNGNVTSAVAGTDYATVPADYVVSQGTSGIWTYRKWNSGQMEAWARYSYSGVSTASTGALYRGRITLPSAVTGMTQLERFINQILQQNAVHWVCGDGESGMYIYAPVNTQNLGGIVSIYDVGTWK